MRSQASTTLSTESMSQLGLLPLDTSTIPQSKLNIENKVRSNLLPWKGQFSPQLVDILLETFASPGDCVLDPFVGSGTVLVESARHGLAAYGAEVNPAAFHIATLYQLINMSRSRRTQLLADVDGILGANLPEQRLFSAAPDPCTVQHALRDAYRACRKGNKKLLLASLIVLLDFHNHSTTLDRVWSTWSKLSHTILELPHTRQRIQAFHGDARSLPLGDSVIDLVVTSPPYINVFNYHQQYRQSTETLGYNLLHVARSEIGSNRKHRGNRFLTVTQYCLDMALVLRELRRVCSPDSRLILIVGRESNVRKTPFYNAAIVAELGVRCADLSLVMRQERVFRNRFGIDIYEDILHFAPRSNGEQGCPASVVAHEVLRAARRLAPDGSISDLEDAIDRVAEVEASRPLEALLF